ncbi:MAG: CHAT domain-containing protein, partial [Cyanothece sp. SIO1E1]|nr:CHAT domain-containing protein [Cyanothece sp. SIO1E1]
STLTGDEIDLFTGGIAGTGGLTLQPLSASQAIAIGGSDSTATLDLTVDDLGDLQDGFSSITLGQADSIGEIIVAGEVTFSAPLVLLADDITFNAPVTLATLGDGLSAEANSDIFVNESITVNGGAISLLANADQVGFGQVAAVNALISAAGGNIVISGDGDADPGIAVVDSFILSSGEGAIALNGTSIDNDGIAFSGSSAGISAVGGEISLTGTSTTEDGIDFETGAFIDSDSGGIRLIGTSLSDDGIDFEESAAIASVSGEISLTGTSTSGDGIDFDSGAAITSVSGRVSLTGTATGEDGIDLDDAAIASVSGEISLTGISSSGPGLSLSSVSPLGSTITSDGDISLTGDEIDLSNVSIAGTGGLTLQPLSASQAIAVGGSDSTAALDLTATELSFLQDGFELITIGQAGGSGTITVAPITLSDPVLFQAPAGSVLISGGVTLVDDAVFVFDASGVSTILSTDITSSTPLTFFGDISLEADITISTTVSGSDITFDGTLNGNQVLAVIAADSRVQFNDAVGASIPLAGLSVTSQSTDIAGNVTTEGDISFNSPVTLLDEAVSISAGSGGITTGNITEDAGSAIITLTAADDISVADVTVEAGLTLDSDAAVLAGNLTIFGSNPITVSAGDDISVTSATTTGGLIVVGEETVTAGNLTATGSSPITIIAEDNIAVADIISDAGLELDSDAAVTTGNLVSSGSSPITVIAEDDISVTNVTTDGGLLISSEEAVTAGNLTAAGGSPITIVAGDNIAVADVISDAGVSLSSEEAVSTGNLTSANNGPITVSAEDDITVANVTTSAVVTLESDAAVTAGNLTSVGNDITVIATDSITTGEIDASSSSGDGGDVILDPIGDIEVGFINAEGGPAASGGNVEVVTGKFFRATGTFTDQNGSLASISTAGGAGGGAITITQSGGLLDVPFIVGDATTNGTAAAITSGEFTISPSQSFLASFTLGNISILTDAQEIVTEVAEVTDNPCPPNCEQDLRTIDQGTPDQLSSGSEGVSVPITEVSSNELGATTTQASFETTFTTEFSAYLGLGETLPDANPSQVRSNLAEVQAQANIKPALIYVGFGPQRIDPTKADTPQVSRRDSDRLELILMTADADPIYVRVPEATRKRVQIMAKRFRRQVTNPNRVGTDSYLFAAQALYRWLIAPLEAELAAQNIETIGFVMEAGLRSTPLAALHDGEKFLVEKYNISLIPSLNLTDLSYRNLRDVETLVGGAQEFVDQNPLPFVPFEVKAIQALWSGRQIQDSDFTLTQLQDQLQKRYGIIHLATHGEFLPGKLNQSYIQLFDQKLPFDRVRELGLDPKTVQLITLSACQTALGNREAELGFAGLAVLAGAQSALASLWTVSDAATTGLMAEFYQQLRQEHIKAEALQKAQLALLNRQVRVKNNRLHWTGNAVELPPDLNREGNQDLSHPFFWSAFTLVGSPW